MSSPARRRATVALATTLDRPVGVGALSSSRDTQDLRAPRRRLPRWWSSEVRVDLAAALPGWLTARALVFAALALAHFEVTHLDVRSPAVREQVRQGLFAWDAGFFRGIAAHGYDFVRVGHQPHEALRFFPLYPLVGRGLGVVFGGRSDIALLLLANGAALVVGALLHRLVLLEKGDPAMARRAAWLVAVAPPAFVLVLGYSEALFMSLAVAMFLALRTGKWWWAAAAGTLAGLTRPLGMLLAVPAALEAGHSIVTMLRSGRLHRGAPLRAVRSIGSRLAAIIAAPVGAAIFLGWAWARYGDAWLPLRIQQDPSRRGGAVDPITAVLHESGGILHGHHIGSGLHVPWAIFLVAVLVLCLRRWPVSYGAFATVTLLAALSSKNLDSLERYALSAFPLILAGASVLASERLNRAALVLGGAAMEGYALLAFLDAVVP